MCFVTQGCSAAQVFLAKSLLLNDSGSLAEARNLLMGISFLVGHLPSNLTTGGDFDACSAVPNSCLELDEPLTHLAFH
jgi:hypothetical protein